MQDNTRREREAIEDAVKELSTRIAGRNGSPTEDDVNQAVDLLMEVRLYLDRSVPDSNTKCDSSVIALGTTGVGKSTVVSFLFGPGRLLVHHEKRYSRVLVADPPMPGVKIRSGAISSTLLPVVHVVKLGSEQIAVFDMPGGRDSRGPFAELVVNFIYNWILEYVNDTRFLLVSPPLHDGPQQRMLQDLINSSLIREDNAVVIHTKCAVDFEPESTADLELDETKRNIQSFALPAPVRANPDGHDYSREYAARKGDILAALTKLRSPQVVYDEPLPDAAVLLLDEIDRACIKLMRDKLSCIFLKVYDWAAYRGTYAEIDSTLRSLQDGGEMTIQTAADNLARLVVDGDRLRRDEDLVRIRELLLSLPTDDTEGHKCKVSEWLSGDANVALESAKAELVGLRNAVKIYRPKPTKTSNTLVISAFHLHLSEEQAAIEKFVKKRVMAIDGVDMIPNVILIGFASLEVDVELQIWANVALVSPSIQVSAQQCLVLSAVGQAPSAQKCNDVAGKDGVHGAPGLPGGNLTVVCDNLTDDDQILRTTRSSGQRGGDAQDGGNGVSGEDSKYDNEAFLNAINAEIDRGLLSETDAKLPRDLKGGLRLVKYDRTESPLGGVLYGAPGKKDLTIIRDSEPGNPRRPAGSGGQGGGGGQGGTLLIRSAQDVWEGVGSIGHRGLDGIAGAASRDGFGSPRFTATIQQWYYTGGWFGSPRCKPNIEVNAKPVSLKDQPKLTRAKPPTGKGRGAVDNTGLGLDCVRATYEERYSQLAATFPNCDFSDLMIKWE